MFPSGWNPLTFPIWWIFCENNADWRRVGPRLVAHCYSWCQAPGPRPARDLLPRSDAQWSEWAQQSEQWCQSPGTWSPGHTCKHHTVDILGKARGKCFARDTRLQYPRVTTGSIVWQQPEWSGASSVTWWLIQWYSSSHVNPLSLDITTQDATHCLVNLMYFLANNGSFTCVFPSYWHCHWIGGGKRNKKMRQVWKIQTFLVGLVAFSFTHLYICNF